MIKVTKDGTKTFEIEDSEESLQAARAKGYRPLMTVTKNGKDTFDIDADDTESVQAAFKKGYMDVNAAKNLDASRKEAQKNIGMAESFGQGVASAGTFGFDEEISALISPGDYDKNLEQFRRMKKNREEANPIANLAGNVIGGVAVPGLGAAKAASTAGRVATGAGIGAAQGGLQGLGDSEAETFSGQVADAADDALLGAVLGGATGGLIKPQAAKASAKATASAVKEGVDGTVRGPAEAASRGFKYGAEEAKKLPVVGDLPFVGSAPAQMAGGVVGAAKEILEQKKAQGKLSEVVGQAWPGPKDNWSDATTIVTKALEGGEFNSATDYIAHQASAWGIDAEDYKKLLKMSPERLEEVANFSRREAADDAAPLFQNLKDTFETVRTNRMKELKGVARKEFSSNADPVLDVMERAFINAGELKTTAGAQSVISDAQEILAMGKGSEVFGFQPGSIRSVDQATLFDRLQAARSHIDDNIDWTAIKKGTRSPTPVEKTLMKVRESLDQALKGGSDAKVESDALFRKSKELEERFFKLATDKDGVHAVSLSKLFGNNDRAVKAKKFLEEVEQFAARPDLPDEMRESTKALAENLRGAMQTAEDQRLWGSFNRESRGPTGPSAERISSIMRGDTLATEAILRPGQFLDVKAQANATAKRAFQKPYSELQPDQKAALVEFLTWQRVQAISNKAVSPQESAAKWSEILAKVGK